MIQTEDLGLPVVGERGASDTAFAEICESEVAGLNVLFVKQICDSPLNIPMLVKGISQGERINQA